jgi:single-strand DNA-binding protein
MLRVTLLGNMGGDPELRYTASGSKMVTFNVAVNQTRKGPDGERQENTEWFRIRLTGPRAEFVQRYAKGNRVMVIGRLTISHYQGRDGEPKVGYDVWADEVEGLAPRPRDTDAESDMEQSPEPALAGVSSLGDGESSKAANGSRRRGAKDDTAGGEELEDLPF